MRWEGPAAQGHVVQGNGGQDYFGHRQPGPWPFQHFSDAMEHRATEGRPCSLVLQGFEECQSCGKDTRPVLPPTPILAASESHSRDTLLYLFPEMGLLTSFLGSASLGVGLDMAFH